jgi:cytochrome c553
MICPPRRAPARGGAALPALAALVLLAAGAAGQDAPVDPLSFDRSISPLLSQYCYRCHGEQKTKGDVNLQRDENPLMIADHRHTWSTALKMLRAGEMPPEKAKQPSTEERERLIAFVDRTINVIDCSQITEPGRPAFRRLNRVEYDNTIRALFHLDLAPAKSFAPDGSSYGFDNISDALSISPLQVEQYFQAADQILDAAFKDHRALTALDLHPPSPGMDPRQGARTAITAFARRAFRKPVDGDTVERLLAIFDVAMKQKGNYLIAMRAALKAMLVSPRFLIRIEDADAHAAGPYAVGDDDLACRLSYFLWSSPPDDELMRLADDKRLHEPAVLAQQVHRMMADARSAALAENLFGQWLQLRAFADHRPDAQAFPGFTPSLRRAMSDEASLFLAEMVHADRPLTDLLDANYTFLNQELAAHYGISGVSGSEMRRVALSDHRRGGVMTMGAILILTATPTRSNIPRRGNYILGTLLGMPPPPPPADVPKLMAAADGKQHTLREMLQIHRTNPECAACHAKMDPLGFALENYDAVGRWIETQDGRPIDASGTLPSGESFSGAAEMKKVLVARKDEFLRTVCESTLIYALGRGLQRSDECVMKDLLHALDQDSARVSALVTAICTSYPFTHRRNAD